MVTNESVIHPELYARQTTAKLLSCRNTFTAPRILHKCISPSPGKSPQQCTNSSSGENIVFHFQMSFEYAGTTLSVCVGDAFFKITNLQWPVQPALFTFRQKGDFSNVKSAYRVSQVFALVWEDQTSNTLLGDQGEFFFLPWIIELHTSFQI